MNKNAVSQFGVKARFLVSALAAAMLLVGLCSTSYAASPVSKDGTIHACYKVKGKPKGTLRVVGAQKRCKRGERKVVWNASGQGGQSGTAGQNGQGGSSGSQGQGGTDGTSSANELALKTQIASLNVKIDGLEKILGGLTNGDLLGAVSTVKGLTNTDLTETVDALPVVSSLCDQNEEMGKQINLISGVVKGLGLSSALEALGLLVIPALPTDLPTLGC
jgi:hypothetical protein